jgi:hypothetical protein
MGGGGGALKPGGTLEEDAALNDTGGDTGERFTGCLLLEGCDNIL